MMNYNPSKEELDMLKQKVKHLYCKLELLDKDMNVISNLEGLAIDGSLSIDANSDIRRTFSSTIYLEETASVSQFIAEDWANKYVRIYIGIRSAFKKTYWYNQGTFAFNTTGFQYDATTHTVNISCVDLVAELDGTLGGKLTGMKTIVEEGADIGNAIANTYWLSGMKDCIINYWNRTVPCDQEFEVDTSIWQILTQLRDLYYPFEMFFDDTTFICQEIPSGFDDPLIMDSDMLDSIVISESGQFDYSQVKNCIELWGASNEYDTYVSTDKTTVSSSGDSSNINLQISLSSLSDSPAFSFTVPTDGLKKNVTITAQNTTTKTSITYNGSTFHTSETSDTVTFGPAQLYERNVDENGNDVLIDGTTIPPGAMVVIVYNKETKKYYYQGEQQIHVMVKLVDKEPTNSEKEQDKKDEACNYINYVCLTDDTTEDIRKSRFTIEQLGRRNEILSGSEYEVYTTVDQAMDCAEYMLWKGSRLTDSVTIECLLVPWLDVNQKVSYVPKYINTNGEAFEYLIKSISISLGEGTMSLTLSRYYPYYPFIVEDKY